MPRRWSGAAPKFQAVKKGSPEGAGLVLSPIKVTGGGRRGVGGGQNEEVLGCQGGGRPRVCPQNREPRGAQATGTLDTHLTRRARVYAQAEERRHRK